jgi:hypothetical protein
LYTEAQRVWNATNTTLKKLSTSKKAKKPVGRLRLFLYEILDSGYYEVFIMTVRELWPYTLNHKP